MRYRLSTGQRSRRYAPGQYVSTAYAVRYPHKVEPDEREEWEVSFTYKNTKKKGQIEDVTVRMVARQTGKHQREDVRAAFWVGHKRGVSALMDWRVAAVDWRGYEYPTANVGVGEVMENLGGIINTVGMDALRVERVEV